MPQAPGGQPRKVDIEWGEYTIPVGCRSIALSGLYLGAAFLCHYPTLKLRKYARRIESFLTCPSVANLAAVRNEQQAFWIFVALTAIMFVYFGPILSSLVISTRIKRPDFRKGNGLGAVEGPRPADEEK